MTRNEVDPAPYARVGLLRQTTSPDRSVESQERHGHASPVNQSGLVRVVESQLALE